MPLGPEDVTTITGRDRLGEKVPHRLSGFRYMGVFMQAGLERREVPAEFWKRNDDEAAVVSCPCGSEPVVPVAQHPVACACERRFFFDGTTVWALLSPGNALDSG